MPSPRRLIALLLQLTHRGERATSASFLVRIELGRAASIPGFRQPPRSADLPGVVGEISLQSSSPLNSVKRERDDIGITHQ